MTGGLGSLAGITIYYFLPLSVLTFNLGLLLEIFFFILLGMIFGLTLVALNLQRMLEHVVVYVFLFFERKSIKILILKNLSAHRESNRMTSIIYSLTLGSIIFIIVAANLQIALFTTSTEWGQINFQVTASWFEWESGFTAKQIDPVLKQFAFGIDEFAYATANYYEQKYTTYSLPSAPFYTANFYTGLTSASPSKLLDSAI